MPYSAWSGSLTSASSSLIAAWVLLGKVVRGPEPPTPRALLLVLAAWAAPLLLAPPLFSRDVYSYLAQGAMVDAHIDVYANGPAQLGGPLADEVAPVWQQTSTPDSVWFFLAVASALSGLTRGEIPAGLLGMRLVALLGVGLMAAALPRLARHSGADPAAALWLGALNPLVLLHLVAGAHNDAIMLGLLGVAGCCARPMAPAGRRPDHPRRTGQGAGRARPAGGGGAARASRSSTHGPDHDRGRARHHGRGDRRGGHGVRLDSGPEDPRLPAQLVAHQRPGRATGALLEDLGSGLAPLAMPVWHATGLAVTVLVVLFIWLRLRPGPIYALGLSLGAVAWFGRVAVRPVGPVPHRRRAQRLGAPPGRGGQCGTRAARPAQWRTAGRGSGGAGRIRRRARPRRALAGPSGPARAEEPAQPPVLGRTA